MATIHVYRDGVVRPLEVPATRPLRWTDWHPQDGRALLVGNRGEAWQFDGERTSRIDTGTTHNLRGVAWSHDGSRALLCGNRGAVLLYDGQRFDELRSGSVENLRRVAWSPDGATALIIGNAGTVLRFDTAAHALTAVPGDRAHTLRSIAWRPDGAYALIGAYASSYAGYPRPHVLYRCDGRYTQALLATDDEDDAVAVSWRPGVSPSRALVLAVSYSSDRVVANKLFEYDGSGFSSRQVESPSALLGAAWRPDGAEALLCGEAGALFRFDGDRLDAITSGTKDNLVGPFWSPDGASALFLKGPAEKVYTV
jgi:Tol biopolymer transport system component